MLNAVPVASVMIASLVPLMVPVIASTALAPSLGLVMFLAWRLLRPGLWPVWIGLPLGLWDDAAGVTEVGSGPLLWTAAVLAIDYLDRRLYWRGFAEDWAIAAGLIAAVCLVTGWLGSGGLPASQWVWLVAPQILMGICLFPLATRLVAALDRIRQHRR